MRQFPRHILPVPPPAKPYHYHAAQRTASVAGQRHSRALLFAKAPGAARIVSRSATRHGAQECGIAAV
jgi:hypothetical protein